MAKEIICKRKVQTATAQAYKEGQDMEDGIYKHGEPFIKEKGVKLVLREGSVIVSEKAGRIVLTEQQFKEQFEIVKAKAEKTDKTSKTKGKTKDK